MILAVTGHRPDKIRVQDRDAYDPKVFAGLVEFAGTCLEREAPELVVTGMAQGWDQAIATACLDTGLPYLAAVPFKEQPSKWPEAAQRAYYRLLSGAREVRYVSASQPIDWQDAARMLHLRNHWMVDELNMQGDHVLALWDGSRGGTGGCVHYAEGRGRPVVNVWDKWVAFTRAGVPTT